ncbi:MAG TPA: TatD family hydrolase [Flavisolibacter sp.]|nr:TatD family hydrolase [Flavisolibacter sp.]
MYLIDSHAHIYLPEFDEDRQDCIKRAKEAGIEKIFMPAIDSSTHEMMLKTEAQFPSCTSMIGLHPCSVTADYAKELEVVESYLQKRSFIAIGEIGLDFYWDKTFTEQQYKAFHHQAGLALNRQLPIVIHSRNAIDECIDVVAQYPGLTGVFHCFSGSYQQAEKISQTGFMLGIGGVVSFKNAGLDKVIEKTGINRIILETDAPYLAPVPYRGKRNEPAYTKLIAEKLSQITGLPLEQVAELTTQNAERLFKL